MSAILSGQRAEKLYDQLNVLLWQLPTELIPRHNLDRVGEGRRAAIVEIGCRDRDIAQTWDTEYVTIVVLARDREATKIRLGDIGAFERVREDSDRKSVV